MGISATSVATDTRRSVPGVASSLDLSHVSSEGGEDFLVEVNEIQVIALVVLMAKPWQKPPSTCTCQLVSYLGAENLSVDGLGQQIALESRCLSRSADASTSDLGSTSRFHQWCSLCCLRLHATSEREAQAKL